MENEKYVYIDEKSIKRAYRKMRIRKKADKVAGFVERNIVPIATLGPMVAGGASKLIKFGVKQSNLKREKANKELYCYDRSLGHYWALKRKLTNKDWTAIDRRRKNGERLSDILNDLHVLK